MQQIDLTSWPRAQHYAFFANMANPYFSVCVRLDMAALYQACKQKQISFYLGYLFAVHKTINENTDIRLRIAGGKVYQLARCAINAVQLEGDLFKISYLPDEADFSRFCEKSQQAFALATSQPLLSEQFKNNEGKLDCIHVSVLPWLDFSSFSHATNFGTQNGIPKLVFGKLNRENFSMPLAIDVHHGLMDGLHVARFIEALQANLNQPSWV